MARGLRTTPCLFPRTRIVRLRIRDCDPRSLDWAEEARGRATGLVLTQPDGSLSASRAVLRCNRIQLDAMRSRVNQPGFLLRKSASSS